MKKGKKDDGFARGVKAAAGYVAQFDTVSSHPYRLEDCVLCKLNQTSRKNPRKNPHQFHEMTRGVVMTLALMHQQLVGGNSPEQIRSVARACGVTIKVAKAAGCAEQDIRELERAGVR